MEIKNATNDPTDNYLTKQTTIKIYQMFQTAFFNSFDKKRP